METGTVSPRGDVLLAAVDGGEDSSRVLAYVGRFAAAQTNLRVIVACLYEKESEAAAARDVVGRGRRELLAAGVSDERVETVVTVLPPDSDLDAALIDVAVEHGADTLVVGWDGYAHLRFLLHRHLGEILAVKARPVNLWIVRNVPARGAVAKITLAVDDTESSVEAARYAGQILAGFPSKQVQVFRALEPIAPLPSDYDTGGEDVPTNRLLAIAERRRLERAKAAAQSLLDRVSQVLLDAGLERSELTVTCTPDFVVEDAIPRAIAAAAQEFDSGTLVVGCHAMSWSERLFRRHVAAQLLDETDTTTLWVVNHAVPRAA